jgi:hypothetical protein
MPLLNHDQTILVTLKAFGDFVIAANVASRFFCGNQGLEIVAGNYTRDLAEAMGVDHITNFIGGEGMHDVPSIYNIRKDGLVNAGRSLVHFRKEIGQLPVGAPLIFDRLGWRERIIGSGYPLREIPRSVKNIYLGYSEILMSLGFEENKAFVRKDVSFIRRVLIIPGARSVQRIIPSDVLINISERLLVKGVECKIILFEGEYDHIANRTCVEKIPRNFISLVDKIKSADLIVSADSLPAHLGEFCNIPVFVFTPIPDWTIYWLPKSAYQTNAMSTFKSSDIFFAWLDKNFPKI